MLLRTSILLLAAFAASAQTQPPLAITSSTPPIGVQGKPYSFALTATGGLAPYVWNIRNGVLPLGLTLNGNVISGTPTGPEVQVVELRVRDAETTAVWKAFTFTTQHVWGPYQVPAAANVCQVDLVPNPPVVLKDPVTDKKNCFSLSLAAVTALTRQVLTETNGILADGNVDYKYPNWFEYLRASIKKQLVPGIMDQYPSVEVQTAQAAFNAAKAALDAAKALDLGQ